MCWEVYSLVFSMKNDSKIQQNEFGQMVGWPVEQHLVPQIATQTLQGQRLSLIPFSLTSLSQMKQDQLWYNIQTEPDGRCWTYLPYSGFDSAQDLQTQLTQNFGFVETLHYFIETQQGIAGWVALLNLRATQGVVEIGNVYFSHVLRQSTASTEAIFLLLQACFKQGFRRVEWKCDDLNVPSKRAALRFGFQYEGTFRQDRIAKGRNRNTAWFSIIDEEWPELEQAYIAWLHPNNFEHDGQQRNRLQNFIQQDCAE